MNEVTIGIVEDNQDFSDILYDYLSLKGYKILFRAINGKNAVELYKSSMTARENLLKSTS